MAKKTFAEVFSKNMTDMGLPVPESLFGTLSTTLATVGALAGAITKLGADATLAEVFLTASVGSSAAATATAVSEVVALCGACAASFYVGACIGSILVAAYETLDISEVIKVLSWVNGLKSSLGASVSDYLKNALAKNSKLSPVRKGQVLARRASGSPRLAHA